MKIYFVRHGEAHSNVDQNIPSSKDELTETGRKQAHLLALRFKEIPIDRIISSSIKRAYQTAQEIATTTGKPITEEATLRERKGDFEILWEHRHLPTRELESAMRKLSGNQEWSIGVDEPFEEIKQRIRDAKAYIEKLEDEDIVVVTHSSFLKAFAGYLILGEDMTEKACVAFIMGLDIRNTGVTVCKFNRGHTKPSF